MRGRYPTFALLALVAVAGPLGARATIGIDGMPNSTRSALRPPPYLQCVPFARQATGVAIYGDAHTWWDQAERRYARGSEPRVGAVMAFRAYGSSRLGHVAAVNKIVDSRTVLISHANWSPIDGRRGQIERNVKAVDVSPNNDWSRVRVWFAPIKALGGTAWPLAGFIYNQKPGETPKLARVARTAQEKTALVKAASARPRTPIALPKGRDPIGEIIARGR